MIYSKLLENIDPNWTVKEKVRRLFRDFCLNSSYDQRFMFGKDPELLESIYYRDIDIDKDEDSRVVCRSSTKAFIKLLERINVRAEMIEKESSVERPIDVPDVAGVFYDEEGKKYYFNIVGDIENCRYGLRTEYFGITRNGYKDAQDVEKISASELEEIDKKTGSINQYGYSNCVFSLLSKEAKDTGAFKKFLQSVGVETRNMTKEDVMLNKMMYITRLVKFLDRTAGPFERKEFYKKLFCGAVLDKFESKRFHVYDFYRIQEDGEVQDRSVLEIKLKNKDVYFVYDENECTYVQRTDEEVANLVKGFSARKMNAPTFNTKSQHTDFPTGPDDK